MNQNRRSLTQGLVLVLAFIASTAKAQEPVQNLSEPPPLPNLTIPAGANLETLDAIMKKAQAIKPHGKDQYEAMQTAIRNVSKEQLRLLKGKEASDRYQRAERENIAATVSLMTFVGEDAQQKALEKIHKFLNSRKSLTLGDVNTGMLAAAMLELQPNKKPARDTYELLDELLKEDKRKEMQSLRLNLQAAIRRLNLLGNKFELVAKDRNGKPVEIDDFAGNFVVVDFFATWCKPCLIETPRLKMHYQKYHAKGLDVIGISLDTDAEALDKYLKRASLPWPVIHDNAKNPLDRIQMEFGVSQLPTVLLLNKEGTVVSLEARGAELDRLMEMLFEAPTPASEIPEQADATVSDNAKGAQ